MVSMVPAAAAGVEFARLEDAKAGPFLPGARVTCVMLVITRGQSPFLIGPRRQVQFQRSVLGVLVREVRSLLAREARGHHVNWFNCCGPGSRQMAVVTFGHLLGLVSPVESAARRVAPDCPWRADLIKW